VTFNIAPAGTRWRVPSTALIFDTEGTRVAVVGADNKISFRNVTPGRDFGDRIDIQAGLHGGETIVAQPTLAFVEGRAAKPLASRPSKGARRRPRGGSPGSGVPGRTRLRASAGRATRRVQVAGREPAIDAHRAGVVALVQRAGAGPSGRDRNSVEPD